MPPSKPIYVGERGQALPLFAVTLLFLLSLAAFAIDLAILFDARAEAQRVADASALAGASQYFYYADSSAAATAVDSMSRDLAKKNTIRRTAVTAVDIDTVMPDPATFSVGVRIQRRDIPLLFAKVLGFSTKSVRAFARARAAPAGTVACAKPVAIADPWNEPSSGGGVDTLHPYIPNRIWDIPPSPATGIYATMPGIEAWRFYSGAPSKPPGQTYSQSANGFGSTFRNGQTGVYQPALDRDWGRRIVLNIEQPGNQGNGNNGNQGNGNNNGTQEPLFYRNWGLQPVPCGNCVGGNKDVGVAAGVLAGCGIQTSVNKNYEIVNEYNGWRIGPAWQQLVDRDPGASWQEGSPGVPGQVVGSSYGSRMEQWLNSPRVITVAVFDPSVYGAGLPQGQTVKFNNFVSVFVEKPFYVGPAKNNNSQHWVTGIVLKWARGVGDGPGNQTGPTTRALRLVQ
jgi:hypothetical protein